MRHWEHPQFFLLAVFPGSLGSFWKPECNEAFGMSAHLGVLLRGKRIRGQDKKRSGAAALRKLTEGASLGASGVCAGRGVALSRGIDPLSLREGGLKSVK